MKSQRKRFVGFERSAVTPVPTTSAASKIDFIRKGKKKKTITKFKENKNITFENQGGKFIVVEKEKKVEEEGVTRKKRNYIMYESKLGTEKERDMTKIEGKRRKREIRPRVDEKIIIKKKRHEYLDNYQYHETKVIKNPKPRNTSYVQHKRLGDIIGGSYEQTTYHRQIVRTEPQEEFNTVKSPSVSYRNTRTNSSILRNKPSTQTFERRVATQSSPYNSNTARAVHTVQKSNNINNRFTRSNYQIPRTPEYTKEERRTITRGGKTTVTTTTTTMNRTTTTRGRGRRF
jgi:hypothetical protein